MWIIKEQTKKSPSGVKVSPVLQTQPGAEEMLALYRAEAEKAPDYADNPKYYFICNYIPRTKK